MAEDASRPGHRGPAESGGEFSLLGGFVFSVGGDALLWISAGSQRLLAFLAIRDRAVTRHSVAGTLWPESTDEHAGARLRSAVSRLDGPARQALNVSARDLGLAEGLVVDVHDSQALANRLIDSDALPRELDIGGGAVSALYSRAELVCGTVQAWLDDLLRDAAPPV